MARLHVLLLLLAAAACSAKTVVLNQVESTPEVHADLAVYKALGARNKTFGASDISSFETAVATIAQDETRVVIALHMPANDPKTLLGKTPTEFNTYVLGKLPATVTHVVYHICEMPTEALTDASGARTISGTGPHNLSEPNPWDNTLRSIKATEANLYHLYEYGYAIKMKLLPYAKVDKIASKDVPVGVKKIFEKKSIKAEHKVTVDGKELTILRGIDAKKAELLQAQCLVLFPPASSLSGSASSAGVKANAGATQKAQGMVSSFGDNPELMCKFVKDKAPAACAVDIPADSGMTSKTYSSVLESDDTNFFSNANKAKDAYCANKKKCGAILEESVAEYLHLVLSKGKITLKA